MAKRREAAKPLLTLRSTARDGRIRPHDGSGSVCHDHRNIYHLVGGLEHFLFSHILGIIIPIDELIFFRGVAQPPTSHQYTGPMGTASVAETSMARTDLQIPMVFHGFFMSFTT